MMKVRIGWRGFAITWWAGGLYRAIKVQWVWPFQIIWAPHAGKPIVIGSKI